MKLSKRDQRFLQSTQGQIVLLLRGQEQTVEDLADALKLTGNAVRAQLVALERDGLVEEVGVRPGVRKSHKTYSLSREGDQLFPKAFDLLLNRLLGALKGRMSSEELLSLLQQTALDLAPKSSSTPKIAPLDQRLERALEILTQIGGCAKLQKESNKYVISSASCPLSAIVSEHPEACELARALLENIIKLPVCESCTHGSCPSCRFEIAAPS